MEKHKKWFIALQLLVTGALLAWIFGREDFRNQIGSVLLKEDPTWLWLGFALAGISNLLGVVRWQIFLRVLAIRISFWRATQIYFLALFGGTFLVGAVGGDAARILILIGQGYRRSAAVISVVLDRISGLVILVLSSFILMLWKYEWLSGSPIIGQLMRGMLWYFGALAGFLILSFVSVGLKWPDRLPERFPFRARVQEFCRGYYEFVVRWPQALLACTVSLGVTFLGFAVFYCSARAAGVAVSLGEVFSFMPIVEAITGLPISFGGLGVREHLFSRILGDLVGVPLPQAVTVSITGYLLLSLWALAGALAFPFLRSILKKGRDQSIHESNP